ncbi:MAG: DUF3244 domain-containing protein, partial [Paludibacter sp.]
DTGGGTIGSNSIIRVSQLRTVVITPVFADLSDTELLLSFNIPVGTAQITVEDEMGGIVYMYSLDTNSSSELIIPIDGWDSGSYRINISYGATKLVGDFNF